MATHPPATAGGTDLFQVRLLTLKEHLLPGRTEDDVSQFLASAAGEKLAVLMTIDYLKREAASGRREDFEHYLEAVPDTAPQENDRIK